MAAVEVKAKQAEEEVSRLMAELQRRQGQRSEELEELETKTTERLRRLEESRV